MRLLFWLVAIWQRALNRERAVAELVHHARPQGSDIAPLPPIDDAHGFNQLAVRVPNARPRKIVPRGQSCAALRTLTYSERRKFRRFCFEASLSTSNASTTALGVALIRS